MAYREVAMHEVKEVLRLWLAGVPKKRIALQLSLDPKTVRRYVAAGEAAGLPAAANEGQVPDAVLTSVMTGLRTGREREHGESWARCEQQRGVIADKLREQVRLSKVRRLLGRGGVEIPYSTLHRFAVEELGYGRRAATVPVADGAPGEEIQVDTGWVARLDPDVFGRQRRMRAWIFTPSVSRYRFVYPCFEETTALAIEACESAWEFYGGIFHVLVVDNTKAIVDKADPLRPRINAGFLEYAQARGFHIDTARVRSPKDKGRVERSVRDVRDDCFAGEHLRDIEGARRRALVWSRTEYGMRRHSTTGRLPKEHFESDERSHLLPTPASPYDVPIWAEPIVGRDHYAQVARGLYTLPTRFIGKKLRARADRSVVVFYDGPELVKTHPRVRAGERSTDRNDFPPEKAVYAQRDVAFLQRQADQQGAAVGRFAARLLEGPLPWTRMRHVYALLGLVKRYGAERVNATCDQALAADMLDLHRLKRMLALALPPVPSSGARVIPLARYLRPADLYALRRTTDTTKEEESDG